MSPASPSRPRKLLPSRQTASNTSPAVQQKPLRECKRYMQFNSTPIPSSVRAAVESLRARKPVIPQALPAALPLNKQEVRAHIHDHLLSPEPWSVYNVANLARFTIERLSRGPVSPTPYLDYLSSFNLSAAARGVPPLSFSEYVVGMHQFASVTCLVEICGTPPDMVRFIEPGEPPAPAGLKPPQSEAIAALFQELCNAGVSKPSRPLMPVLSRSSSASSNMWFARSRHARYRCIMPTGLTWLGVRRFSPSQCRAQRSAIVSRR